ncbi:hypothetical protein V2J09_000316 [Rumex salicifolius]
MEEVGQPLGALSGTPVSWAEKVGGGGAGGMPTPKSVMDDEFVISRLSLGFLNGEDGEPEVVIEQEVLDNMNKLWKRCMIFRVLGRSVTIVALDRRLRELWKPRGGMYIVDLPRQYFLVRFDSEEEYESALTGGPWKVFGSYLMTQAWSPDFDPLCDDIVTTPVWVRLTNLPVNFYHRAILKGIASGLGNPVKVDMTTLRLERARFARVCVEVNLKRPLKGMVVVNGYRYFVSYEGLTNICSGCGIYGHLMAACPRRPMETECPTTQGVTGTSVAGAGSQAKETDGGITLAKNPARRSEASDRGMGSVGSGNPEIGTDAGKIVTSNRFGNLGEDSDSVMIMEGSISADLESDIKVDNGKNVGQGSKPNAKKDINLNMHGGTQNTPNRNKSFTAGENSVAKPKPRRQSRPTRGLVFGPTRGERELTLTGKRLRVENRSSGRPGGAFVNAASPMGAHDTNDSTANPVDDSNGVGGK